MMITNKALAALLDALADSQAQAAMYKTLYQATQRRDENKVKDSERGIVISTMPRED